MGRLASVTASLVGRMTDLAFGLACVALCFQLIGVSTAVALRLVGGRDIPGLLAYTEWSLVYFAFLAAPRLSREGKHVAMDFFDGLRPSLLTHLLVVMRLLVGIAAFSIVAIVGVILVYELISSGESDMFKMRAVPIWTVVWVIPFSGALVAAELLILLIRFLVNRGKPASLGKSRPNTEAI